MGKCSLFKTFKIFFKKYVLTAVTSPVSAFILYHLNQFVYYLLAPIYFHFGHYSFVLDVLTVGGDVVDTLGIYFLSFFFISGVIFHRNYILQILNKLFFKNYFINRNILPLLNNFSSFFADLGKGVKNIFKAIYRKISKKF
jgi:hypothetical protein